jgi:hypothetical protein
MCNTPCFCSLSFCAYNPLNHLDDHRSTLVKTLAQNPSYSLNLLCHCRTLARSPKISLNTPKPPKKKNVQNVGGHNFAVEWHLKFRRILGETNLGRCPAPVHWRRVFSHVGMAFLLHSLDQTHASLCESCRGIPNLQLCFRC